MDKQYKCIKPTIWRGVMVSPDPKKPVVVSVSVSKTGKTILDDNDRWEEFIPQNPDVPKSEG